MKKERLANIEILRIISMLFVLIVHYNRPINGIVCKEMVLNEPLKAIGISSLNALDFVCVNCFIIISGYFGIQWKLKGLLNFLF